MANKRTLKKAINSVCGSLLAESVAATLYNSKYDTDNMEAFMAAVLRINAEYIKRVSYPQPGMPAKAYYKKLVDDFAQEMNDIIDGVNNIH